MRRIAIVMIAAMALLTAGCGDSGSGQDDNETDPTPAPPPPVASPDTGCTEDWPRRVTVTGELVRLAVVCVTDDGTSMRLSNVSPAVLRVTNKGSATVHWHVDRPTSSLTTQALKQVVPANFIDGDALVVPDGALVASSTAAVRIRFWPLPQESTLAYGSKLLVKWAEGYYKKVRYTPGQRFYLQVESCAKAAYQLFQDLISQRNEQAIIQIVETYLPCRGVYNTVRNGVDSSIQPRTVGKELAAIGKLARSSLLEDAIRLGARAVSSAAT